MSQRQYSWRRDSVTGVAVLHWSEDGGKTWAGYYKPIEGKTYNGLGQMEKMRELKRKGYIFIDNPSLREVKVEPAPSKGLTIEEIFKSFDSYGEEDPLGDALSRVRDYETDYHAFVERRNKKAQVEEDLTKASQVEVLEKALQELKTNLEGAKRDDLIGMVLESYMTSLKGLDKKEVIKFALDMYERNVKVQKLKEAIKMAYG